MSAQPESIGPTDLPFHHTDAYRLRRFWNWFPLGLAYAFLYMGRYNLTVAKNALGDAMTKEDFGVIFGAGTLTYGLSFLFNGPMTDRIGGKKAMLMALGGSGVMNIVMGAFVVSASSGEATHLRLLFSVLYALNMYFQSLGALAIVKVNAPWFHVRERGGFSGIFGTMISSGIFFAFTVNAWILALAATGTRPTVDDAKWVFFAPAALLLLMFVVELVLLRDRPSAAGHADFDTGDASSGESDAPVPILALMKRILMNPVIFTIALIEFCTGVLRNGVMHWYPIYSKEVLVLPSSHFMRDGSWERWYLIVACLVVAAAFFVFAKRTQGKRKGWLYVSGGLVFLAPFLQGGWGGILMVAGVIGGNLAGWVSDLFFQSRRAPAAGGLYLGLTVVTLFMYFALGGPTNEVAWSTTDAKASQEGFDQFVVGDVVTQIADRPVRDWNDVARAVQCLPATCKGSAKFDAETCMCASEAKRPVTEASSGSIEAQVLREGNPLQLKLRDPQATMRAGDTRKLAAGPVSRISPLWLGIVLFFMSVCVIGTHGLLSGTATMDFGGRKGAATAVGLIDGFVYLGTALQSFALGFLTTKNWIYWPLFLMPFALIGFLLSTRIWHAKPAGRGGH